MERLMRLLKHVGCGVIGFILSMAACAVPAEVVADVVAVVSADSTVPRLSRYQLADIFLGKASRFPDGSVAVPVDLPESSPARNDFYIRISGKSAAQIKAHWSKMIFTGRGRPPRELPGSIEVKELLLANPNAIGYIDRSLVDESVRVLLD